MDEPNWNWKSFTWLESLEVWLRFSSFRKNELCFLIGRAVWNPEHQYLCSLSCFYFIIILTFASLVRFLCHGFSVLIQYYHFENVTDVALLGGGAFGSTAYLWMVVLLPVLQVVLQWCCQIGLKVKMTKWIHHLWGKGTLTLTRHLLCDRQHIRRFRELLWQQNFVHRQQWNDLYYYYTHLPYLCIHAFLWSLGFSTANSFQEWIEWCGTSLNPPGGYLHRQ